MHSALWQGLTVRPIRSLVVLKQDMQLRSILPMTMYMGRNEIPNPLKGLEELQGWVWQQKNFWNVSR
jgi:hypothetical protein